MVQKPPTRVLVTGGAGFLGSHLVDALVADGASVVVLDDLSTGARLNVAHHLGTEHVDFVEGSMLDAPLVDELVKDVDRVYHLASSVGVQLVVSQPAREPAQQRPRHRHRALGRRAARHPRALHLDLRGLRQEHRRRARRGVRPHPRVAVQGALGLRDRQVLRRGARPRADTARPAPRSITVRLFNTVGPRQTGATGWSFRASCARRVAGADVTVFGDGTQTRCFAHVDDTIRALVELMDTDAALGTRPQRRQRPGGLDPRARRAG